MSKGSNRRRSLVPDDEVQNNWDNIFKNTEKINLLKVDNVKCMWFDCGWCYSKSVKQPHPCPGISRCDIGEVLVDNDGK